MGLHRTMFGSQPSHFASGSNAFARTPNEEAATTTMGWQLHRHQTYPEDPYFTRMVTRERLGDGPLLPMDLDMGSPVVQEGPPSAGFVLAAPRDVWAHGRGPELPFAPRSTATTARTNRQVIISTTSATTTSPRESWNLDNRYPHDPSAMVVEPLHVDTTTDTTVRDNRSIVMQVHDHEDEILDEEVASASERASARHVGSPRFRLHPKPLSDEEFEDFENFLFRS